VRVEEMVKVARPAHLARLAKLTNLTVAAGALFCAGCGVATGPPVRVTIPPGATLRIATDSLAKAGVTVTPKSLELDVKTVLEKVESGDADAAIVYTTDVAAAAGMVTGVVIPDAQNIIATYPIAVVKATANAAAAAAFVTEALSGLIQKALLKRGFLPP